MSFKLFKTSAGLLLAPALLCASFASHAHQAGDIIVRAGVAVVDPQDSSSYVQVNGVATPLKAGVDSNTQLGITGTYMLTDQLGIGLLAATPFQHTVSVNGAPGLDGKLADIKHLPPTLTLQYFPLASSSAWQPYVGAGLNYTTFFSEDLTSEREQQGFSGLSLDDSWGLALEAGVDYQLSERLLVNASVWHVDIDTEANFRLSGAPGKVKVDIDPWVYMLALGYKF
ncbi:MAG: OmpW family outer membrane protein [Pseudoalteromonas distincta]|jgi:outer membrane protein|tara:strand:+ start:21362 stop:22042 length:681 start_codon:yes stop_codon:yes gene_type:complete